MNKNSGNPLMEEVTLENVFSATNKHMPSIKKVIAQFKYDANKMAQAVKNDKSLQKLLEDAAREEEILMSGMGASRRVFNPKKASNNINDLYERSSFAYGGGYSPQFNSGLSEGQELEVTPEELENLRAQGYQIEIL